MYNVSYSKSCSNYVEVHLLSLTGEPQANPRSNSDNRKRVLNGIIIVNDNKRTLRVLMVTNYAPSPSISARLLL